MYGPPEWWAGASLIGIDGRSGSGKSSLADELAALIGADVVRLDQLCPGWHGLDRAVDLAVRWVLQPARDAGTPGYRRWDWYTSEYREWVDVPVPDASRPLIVDGCGIGSARARPHLDLLVWLSAPESARYRAAEARERDFRADEAVRGMPAPDDPMWWWPVWAGQEERILAREHTPDHADVRFETADETSRAT